MSIWEIIFFIKHDSWLNTKTPKLVLKTDFGVF